MNIITRRVCICVLLLSCWVLGSIFGFFGQNEATSNAQVLGGNLDPGALGTFLPVVQQDYDLCEKTGEPNECFHTDGIAYGMEMRARIVRPYNLTQGPAPIIILVHGNHATCHDGTNVAVVWPCPTSLTSTPFPNRIDNYKGYDYLSYILASYGYIVVSISNNSIVAHSNSDGAEPRAILIREHLRYWRQWNTIGGGPGDFIGKVDLNRVGVMGHSRGGEGVVKFIDVNDNEFGLRAVLALAPVDDHRMTIEGVPFATLLPYCDGDVYPLDGIHYFDDGMYDGSDPSPRHSFLVMGTNHNFYNSIWTPMTPTPGVTITPGAKDDWNPQKFPDADLDAHCGFSVSGNGRLSADQQQKAAIAYINAFFLTYASRANETSPNRFYKYITGDNGSPPSAASAKVHVSYDPGTGSDLRKDINRLQTTTNLSTNTVNGTVTPLGLNPYGICGGAYPQPAHCLDISQYGNYFRAQQPHTSDEGAYANRPGPGQLSLGWNVNSASYTNYIPPALSNVSRYEVLQFRAAVNFADSRNSPTNNQNFSVELADGLGHSASVLISDIYQSSRPNPLYYPPGSGPRAIGTPLSVPVPHLILNTIRLPLTSFIAQQSQLNLENITSVKFKFDSTNTGALLVNDISFTNSRCAAPPPLPTPPTCTDTDYAGSKAVATATIVAGTTDTGSHCEDCITATDLPFSFRLYDQTFPALTSINLSSNGNIQFNSSDSGIHIQPDACFPVTNFSYAILPYWGDLNTAGSTGGITHGIYTSVSGSSPNRIFNIEWRACQRAYSIYGPQPCSTYVNFEVRLYEGSNQIETVYGVVQDGYNVAVGIQKSTTKYTSYKCNVSGSLPNGTMLTFTQPPCAASSCNITFQDALPNSPFFSYAQCLVCRGVLSGYPCGSPGEPCVCPTSNPYLRVGENISRGALAKLVSNSLGLHDIPIGQTFEDVLPGQTFYDYIERLARRGIINGYICGQLPSEPCVLPGNRPYFRTMTTITRGQAAKIVSEAAGYADTSANQRYEDVPVGSTFYNYIERLSMRQIVNGYACGASFPCVPPANLPYFRPTDPVTRGQASKIVNRTFFPSCGNPPSEGYPPTPVPTSPGGDAPSPIPTP